MKFNWGTGIAAFYILFMVTLLFFVFKSGTYDHSLVMPNYYEEDLKYQEQYTKLANTMAMSTPVKISQEVGKISIRFPEGMEQIEGEVWLFRPSDAKQDLRIPIRLNTEEVMEIPTEKLRTGRWKMKIDWRSGERQYYKEEAIVL
jgi:nitrogen fixation protein FixH